MFKKVSIQQEKHEKLPSIQYNVLFYFRHMPSVGYNGPGSPEWYTDYPRDPSGLINYYMLPPVLYPDGMY